MLQAVKEIYLHGSSALLGNLLGFPPDGDSGKEDGGLEDWLLATSTLPLQERVSFSSSLGLDTSKEIVINDPYRVMAARKNPKQLAIAEEDNIFITPSLGNIGINGKQSSSKKPLQKVKRKLGQKFLKKGKKMRTSLSTSFVSPVKIPQNNLPPKKKSLTTISPQQVAALNWMTFYRKSPSDGFVGQRRKRCSETNLFFTPSPPTYKVSKNQMTIL